MSVMYGIKNCDTVKKARRWLDDHNIAYRFHDYRVDGLDADLLNTFVEQLSWEALLNTRGTTWRTLPESDKADLTAEKACALMLQYPAMIKRPLLVYRNPTGSQPQYLLGFKDTLYQATFAG
ncbi:MAG: ArsC family reductase [Plesiomonas sp.]|uniref:ArsC family reductase n=1 Tax=Plesiomonas sp. TaxID=2486279 RepID=UPI003F35EA22